MTRPLPDVHAGPAVAYWEGTGRGEIVVQACTRCGYRRWPPAVRCPECLGEDCRLVVLRPQGTIWSYATYERSFHPAFDDRVPYVVGLIEMESGILMVGNVLGDGEPAVGAPVVADFEQVTPEITLVHWRLATGGSGR